MPKATMNVSLEINLIKAVTDRALEKKKSISAEFNDLLIQSLEHERNCLPAQRKGAQGSAS